MSFSGECPLCQAEFADWVELETHASRCDGEPASKQLKFTWAEDDELEEQLLREEEARCSRRRLRRPVPVAAAVAASVPEGEDDGEIETLQDNLLSSRIDLQLLAKSLSPPPNSSTAAIQAAKQQMLAHSLVLYTQYRRGQFKT